jgi:glycerol-3-phosphate acyltransferase PlsX
MRIGIDIMGGDFAPQSTIEGCFLARDQIPENIELILIGDRESIIRVSKDNGFDVNKVDIVHASESLLMNDHPYKAFVSKPDSSIVKGFKLLKSGGIDAFCSAGNTGAMLIGASHIITPIPGIIRPAITAVLPNLAGTPNILLDVGINPDSRPDVLYQYGILGSIYSRILFNIPEPKVGLINLGIEEEKGNLVTKSAYQLMKEGSDFNFAGNIEGNEFFINTRTEVLVCDGFVGNVILKLAEGFFHLIRERGLKDNFFDEFNFENYGGTPILGINKPVIVGHGISNSIAVKNMIMNSWTVYKSNLINSIKSVLEQ